MEIGKMETVLKLVMETANGGIQILEAIQHVIDLTVQMEVLLVII